MTPGTPKRRGTRPTHRPEGYRVHFLKLLPQTSQLYAVYKGCDIFRSKE